MHTDMRNNRAVSISTRLSFLAVNKLHQVNRIGQFCVSLSHATGVNQPLRFFKRFLAAEAIELDGNHIKRLVLARGIDLTAIGFGNYRSPQSIGSLEGADGESFVVPSAVSIGWHGAMYRRGLPVRATRLCVKPDGGSGSGVLNRALGCPAAKPSHSNRSGNVVIAGDELVHKPSYARARRLFASQASCFRSIHARRHS